VIDPRTPVLVGVGTSYDDAEAFELMVRATLAAADDAGAPRLLTEVQRVAVPRGTWSYTDPGRIVAERIGATDAQTYLVDLGIPQQTPINEALTAILDGSLDVALVVGAEAKARAARAAKRSVAANAEGIVGVLRRTGAENDVAPEIDQGGAQPDVHQVPHGEILSRPEIEAGLYAPVEQYALMESALRAADGLTIDEHRAEIARLWTQFNLVARTNPDAAFPTPLDEHALMELGPSNRPLAFPYGKWHVSQWTVDQAAALLLCSAARAEAAGIARDRWVFPLVGLESSASMPVTKRRDLHRWPAMRVLGDAAADYLGDPLAACDHVELYSCFPLAVRVQQRELDLPTGAVPTITGGMTFAGGPFNSFVLQATVAMAQRLRERGGRGLVTTVSGMLTKPGLAVWSADPPSGAPLVDDLAHEADAATATVPVTASHDGDARMAACTVTYEGMEPKELVAVLDADDGVRVIAKSTDAALIARATTDELVGAHFRTRGGAVESRR
jgi:acetyl-CoA C-acetyltransferase